MEIKEIITVGITLLIGVLVVSFIFAPTSGAHDTQIQILNKGDLGDNSTIYIKLTDSGKTSLSNETVHVKLIDENGTVVYSEDVVTHATGVGMTELGNVSAGEYTLNITFDGDANYTGCSVSKKVNVKGEVVEDVIDNSTLTADDMDDITD